jgi:hypothetical protein
MLVFVWICACIAEDGLLWNNRMPGILFIYYLRGSRSCGALAARLEAARKARYSNWGATTRLGSSTTRIEVDVPSEAVCTILRDARNALS